MSMILFFVSMAGLSYAFYGKLKIENCFVPVCASSFISLFLFYAGLTGILEQASQFLYLSGIVLFVLFLAERKRTVRIKKHLSVFTLCFISGAAIFAVLVLRLKLTHYDNFSHWALIVKYLLSADRLPGMDTDWIVFPDYPPGCSLFIYYVCRYIGTSQGVMLLAQNILLFSCFWAVFGLVREKRRFLPYAYLAMGLSALSYLNLTVRINNLLVDFLLPMLTLASFSVTRVCKTSLWKGAAVNAMILGFTVTVKGTGIIFALIGLVYYAWTLIQREKISIPEKTAALTVTAAAGLLPAAAWKEYIAVALSGYQGKFTAAGMETVEAYRPALAQDYEMIIRSFIQRSFSLSERSFQVFLLCSLILSAVCIWAKKYRHKKLKLMGTLLTADLLVVLYYLGILGMYLFSMPREEALRLAGFDRYTCSFMVLYAGILLIVTERRIEDSFAVDIDRYGAYRAYSSPRAKRRYQYVVLALVIICINFLYSEINGLKAVRSNYDQTLPGIVERITGDRWYPEGKQDQSRYLVAATDRNRQVTDFEVMYVVRYFLSAGDVTVTDSLGPEDAEKMSENYDYIVVLEPEAVDRQVRERLVRLQKPGIYDTREVEKI